VIAISKYERIFDEEIKHNRFHSQGLLACVYDFKENKGYFVQVLGNILERDETGTVYNFFCN